MARFTIFHSLNGEMGAELDKFVQVMVEKLEKNKHKDALEPPDLPKLMRLALTEMGEVVEQLLRDEADPNMIRECADAANFMFLIARHIHNKLKERAEDKADMREHANYRRMKDSFRDPMDEDYRDPLHGDFP